MNAQIPEEPVRPDHHLPHPVLLLINGNSRTGRQMFGEAVAALRDNGVDVRESHLARDKAETERLLKREVAEGARLVVVGGGDGTLSLCAEFLAGTEVAMGVLPLGTGNTFARSLGLPVDLHGAVETIANGKIRAIDVGRCNKQIFLNSVSLGLSADIAGALTGEVKKKLGLFAWPLIGARVALAHRALKVRVSSSERNFTAKTHQLMIANGRYVAGPIKASEDASVEDGELTVFLLGGGTKRALVRATFDWLRNKHEQSSSTKFFETEQMRVESLGRRLRVNVDGEINDHTPLELSVWPRALRVVVPHDFVADEV